MSVERIEHTQVELVAGAFTGRINDDRSVSITHRTKHHATFLHSLRTHELADLRSLVDALEDEAPTL